MLDRYPSHPEQTAEPGDDKTGDPEWEQDEGESEVERGDDEVLPDDLDKRGRCG